VYDYSSCRSLLTLFNLFLKISLPGLYKIAGGWKMIVVPPAGTVSFSVWRVLLAFCLTVQNVILHNVWCYLPYRSTEITPLPKLHQAALWPLRWCPSVLQLQLDQLKCITFGTNTYYGYNTMNEIDIRNTLKCGITDRSLSMAKSVQNFVMSNRSVVLFRI
jgi:hypothetical protein